MKSIIAVLTMMVAGLAHAEEPHKDSFFKYGVGVSNSAKHSRVETKILSIGRQTPLGPYLIHQVELGVWADSAGDGRTGSGFADYSVGVNVNVGRIYTQVLWGFAGITTPDAYLGGNFMFNQDLSLGVRDTRGVAVGLNYKHISSAGIFMPNIGRDFGQVRVSIPL
jgi:hypothetical protein